MQPSHIRDPQPGVVSGVCWYRRDQWERLRSVASDPEKLEATYDEWLAVMKRSLPDLTAAGLRYELVEIDVEELVRWCRSRYRPVNGSARAEYASHLLHLRHNPGAQAAPAERERGNLPKT